LDWLHKRDRNAIQTRFRGYEKLNARRPLGSISDHELWVQVLGNVSLTVRGEQRRKRTKI
jgi:hypothetical protein